MSSVTNSTLLSSEVREDGVVTVRATTARIAVTIFSLQLVLLLLVGLSHFGISLPLLRPTLAFLYLTFIPGFLILRIIGAVPDSRVDMVAYTVGVSLASLMGVGVSFNFILRFLGVANPISELPLILSISTVTMGLTGVYFLKYRDDIAIQIDLNRVFSPIVLGLALLPFLGIYGALLLNRFDSNFLLLALYGIIALIPIAALYDQIPVRVLPFAVWTIAISLLLQNTLTGQFLAWGDQPREAAVILDVLASGFWSPSQSVFYANKYAMLRVTILHPIYVLFSDLSLYWVLRVFHPVLFSVTPVVLFQAYRKMFGEKSSFLAVFLYMSLFSFFIVLSRNTRTATAIFFLALLILLVADAQLNQAYVKGLGFIFAFSIIVSHYGASYMVMLALILALPFFYGIHRITGDQNTSLYSHVFVLFYSVGIFTWYIYASPESGTFNLFLGFAEHFVITVQEQFISSSSSASTRIVAKNWQSVTLHILKYYNFLIGAGVTLGLGLTTVRGILYGNNIVNDEYLSYSLAFFIVFSITFLPVERFNTARTFAISLVLLSPFLVIGAEDTLRIVRSLTNIRVTKTQGHLIVAVVISIYFLLNVGFVSATVTNEYSPNALVEKDRIMDGATPPAVTYFYRQHPTVYHIQGSQWLATHIEPHSEVYSSGSPGAPSAAPGHPQYRQQFDGRVPYSLKTLSPDAEPERAAYVFLGTSSVRGRVVTNWHGHFNRTYYRTNEFEYMWINKSKIYTNGGSIIYL